MYHQDIFREFDEDGDGVITRQEFSDATTRLGMPLTDDEITRVLKQCDVDQNGTIDLPQFAKYLGGNALSPLNRLLFLFVFLMIFFSQ